MSAKPPEDGWGDTLFHVRRSIRYHMKRERFFAWWHRGIGFFTAAAGTLGAAALLKEEQYPTFALVMTSLIAIAQYADLYFQPGEAARLHAKLRQSFCDLEARLIDLGEVDLHDAMLRRIKADRAVVERDEPTVLDALDLICHNEQCAADGWQPGACGPTGQPVYRDIHPWKLKLLHILHIA